MITPVYNNIMMSVQTADDIDDSNMSVLYDDISNRWLSIDDTYDIDYSNIQDHLNKITLIEKAVIRDNIFSDNEDIDDVEVDHLKYIMIPFVIAKLCFSTNENRLSALERGKKMYISYLNLVDHYGLLPINIKNNLKEISTDSYKPEREEKVRIYKASKSHHTTLEELYGEFMKGSKNKREYMKMLISYKCYLALTDIEMIPQEMEMLKFRNKLDSDSEFKRQYEFEQAKPKPKPFFRKLEEGDTKKMGNNPHLINSKDITRVQTTGTKIDVLDKLYQPDFAQPNMTMDEHAELEYRLMMEKGERDKQNQKMEDEKMDRLNEEEKCDLERLKERAWDDWKDANEKGAGNKKR